MEKATQKIFTPLRVFAALATLLIAILAVAAAAAPQEAWAADEDLPGYYMGYKENPMGNAEDDIYPDEEGRINPGFRWVAADKENGIPAHYENL